MKNQMLSIDLIVTDAGTQMRAGTRMETIKEYQEIASDKGWKFNDPLTVFFDGSKYYLADGFHRYEACVLAKRSSVQCDVINGTLRDAIKYALGANQTHGLRRSNDDKRHAVQFVLADKEWSKLSARAIAEMVGVSHDFVSRLKAETNTPPKVEVSSDDTWNLKNTEKPGVSETVIGKDGKNYPVKQAETETSNEPVWEDVDPPTPKKADWKNHRVLAIKHLESAMRSADDLNELHKYRRHDEVLILIKDAIQFLKDVK